jgi:transcriptional regulator with XRE-family HTH domain
MATVADIVKEGRERRNWSQAELANRAGVSGSTIARVEQDRGLPNSNTLKRLAAAIGYDPAALVRLARNPGAAQPAAWLPDPAAPSNIWGIPGLTTADQLGRLPATRAAPLPAMVRAPHYGGVSAVQSDLREEIGGDFSDTPDVGIDFTVTVDGQCMEPRYQDGERVGCSVRRWEREGFVWEKDYWIRFRNGETTLKRVRPDPRNREKFICLPLNPKSKPFSRLKADVEKAARVLVVLAG